MTNPHLLPQPVMTHEVHIRRGRLINTDPQRRCYNGAYFSSHIEWSEWEHWDDAPSEEAAQLTARLFARDTQQLKVVAKGASK
jgi:hypothetical protein